MSDENPGRATRKAFRRADIHGCAGCGRPLDYGQPSLIAKAPGRALSVFHAACLPRNATVTAVSALTSGGRDPHTEVDRAFFEGNPGRMAYARRPVSRAELELLAVKQLLSMLKAGVPANEVAKHREGTPEILRAFDRDPASVVVLVAQARPGSRVRVAAVLHEGKTIDSLSVSYVEEMGRQLVDEFGGDLLNPSVHVSPIEVQLAPVQTVLAALQGTQCPFDTAQAIGEARHATQH